MIRTGTLTHRQRISHGSYSLPQTLQLGTGNPRDQVWSLQWPRGDLLDTFSSQMDGTKCGHAAEEGSQYTMPIKCQSPHPVFSCLYLSRALALPNFRLLFSLEVSFQTSYSPKPIPFLIYLHLCCILSRPFILSITGHCWLLCQGEGVLSFCVFFSLLSEGLDRQQQAILSAEMGLLNAQTSPPALPLVSNS